MGKWQYEVEGGKDDQSWGSTRKEKTGAGWTFSKKEVKAKEPSWGSDKDLASGQEYDVEEGEERRRKKKSANQANILNILSKLILDANEEEEDEETEFRQSR